MTDVGFLQVGASEAEKTTAFMCACVGNGNAAAPSARQLALCPLTPPQAFLRLSLLLRLSPPAPCPSPHQARQVQLQQAEAHQPRWHVARHDALREALRNRGLAHAWRGEVGNDQGARVSVGGRGQLLLL
jgi:hypothetical protein